MAMKNIQQIPKTGRVGRFAKIVKNKTSEELYLKIMEYSDEYDKYKPDKKALWWKNAIEKLETEIGSEKAVEVMKTCGSKCCGQGQRKTAKRLMNESNSLVGFLEKFINYGVKDGELEYEIINDNIFITRHNKCFCGQVKQLNKIMNSYTYCQCSVEFNRQFFKTAFDKAVHVQLRQSILTGGVCCEFKIRIQNENK